MLQKQNYKNQGTSFSVWLKKFCGQDECGCGLLTSSTLGGVSEAPDHMVHMSWAVVSCQYSCKLYCSVYVFHDQCLGPDEME